MHKFLKLFAIPLNIHDAGTGAAAPQAGAPQPASGQQAKTGEAKPVVVYGKQPTAPVAEDITPAEKPVVKTAAERKADFESMINGEYKGEFAEFFQSTFDRRFKDHKTTTEKLDSLNPLIETLKAKYKVDSDDPKKLVDAFEKDSKFYTELAEEAGMSVDQYKEMLKLRNDGKKAADERDTVTAELQRIQRNNELRMQETTMKSKYPDFDLAKLLVGDAPSNKRFADLLNKGLDVEPAFQAAFFHELMSGVMSSTGKRVEQQVVDNIQAKGQRPREAGAAMTPGIIEKGDVSKLTKADRAEMMRRAARGEKISF